jgi:signal transduction histidine kinase
LEDLRRDLRGARDVQGAAEVTARWVQVAVDGGARLAVAQPDAAGRLRVVWGDGVASAATRTRAARRRAAYQGRRIVWMPLGGGERMLAMVPLVASDRAVGVLEVSASTDRIQATSEVLEAASVPIAAAVSDLAERFESQNGSGVGRELSDSRSLSDAVRIAVGSVVERCRVPVGGWCTGPDGRLRLIAVGGVAADQSGRVEDSMADLPRWGSMALPERQAVLRRFGALVGASRVTVLDQGEVVLLAGHPTKRVRATLEAIGAALADASKMLIDVVVPGDGDERVEMGMAWTAHELRGPLLGLRAALEIFLLRHEASGRDLDILRRSLQELDRLVGSAEVLLAWSLGTRSVQLQQTDLAELIREAAESADLEAGEDRIIFPSLVRTDVVADRMLLRTAILNLLRNAISYSDPGTKVEVAVERTARNVVVSVKNEGPEIRASERGSIFAPFVRGSTGQGRNGSGLGLFITKRAVEAHGGRVWVHSYRRETIFSLQVPIVPDGPPPSEL